jgi:hypothetical protein
MKVHRLILIFILFCLTLLCVIAFANFQAPNNKRSTLCHSSKLLTQIEVKNYDVNGVKLRDGTLIRKIFIDNNRNLEVIIFPRAISPQTWLKIPQSSIQYIGKGGDDSWQEWLRPDYFYLLKVPPNATGLAFGRLCYRNGDVEVKAIKKLKKISSRRININDKIYLSNQKPIPSINPYSVIVNTGSNHRDALGSATEVYFTTENIKLD